LDFKDVLAQAVHIYGKSDAEVKAAYRRLYNKIYVHSLEEIGAEKRFQAVFDHLDSTTLNAILTYPKGELQRGKKKSLVLAELAARAGLEPNGGALRQALVDILKMDGTPNLEKIASILEQPIEDELDRAVHDLLHALKEQIPHADPEEEELDKELNTLLLRLSPLEQNAVLSLLQFRYSAPLKEVVLDSQTIEQASAAKASAIEEIDSVEQVALTGQQMLEVVEQKAAEQMDKGASLGIVLHSFATAIGFGCWTSVCP
jgi:hypothetical protein